MKQRSIIRQLIFYGIAILLVVLAVSALSTRGTETKAYDDVIKAIENAAGEDQSQWIDHQAGCQKPPGHYVPG